MQKRRERDFGHGAPRRRSRCWRGAHGGGLADTLQFLVGRVDTRTPCGWVVDLRHNFGGNMWAMLIGVGPLLGAVSVGSFVDVDGGVLGWWYENGLAGASPPGLPKRVPRDEPSAVHAEGAEPGDRGAHRLPHCQLGEAIVVAFRGRPQTRSFGGATYGVPTANLGFRLADRAFLVVMNALDADRGGRLYDDRIPPDVVIPQTGGPATDDATVLAATSWLATQPACTAAP
jgi:carboxyl-terminal processing protease